VSDDLAEFSEVSVAARVVAVPMRIQHILQGTFVKFLQDCLDFGGQGRELIVHDEKSIGTRGDADVAAAAFEHMDGHGHGGGLDFDLVEVALGAGG